MRASSLVVLASFALGCQSGPPPIPYGVEAAQRPDPLFLNSLQAAAEFCSGNNGPLAFSVHRFDYPQKAWLPATVRPERCYFKPGALLQTFEGAARLTAPGGPSAEKGDGLWMAALASDDAAVQGALTNLFGRGIVRGTEKAASGETVRLYDGAAIQAIFDRLYARPTTVRTGFLLQSVYDVMYRDALRQIATEFALLDANPDLLAMAQKSFDQRVGTDPAFGFFEVGDQVRDELQKRAPKHMWDLPGSFVGFVVRRAHDGSLPVLRGLLTRVMHDYDPTFTPAI